MAETTLKSIVIKRKVKVTIGAEDLGFVKEGTTKYTAQAGEVTEIKEEGGGVIYTATGKPKRTLSFEIYKETFDDIADTELTKRGDLKLEIEGEKAITFKEATAVITREWDNQGGALDKYEVTLPTKGEQAGVGA